MYFFNFSFFLLIISHNPLFLTSSYLRYNPIKKEIPTIKDQDSITIQTTFWLNKRKNISTLEQNSIYKNASMTKFWNHFYPSTNTNKISYSNYLFRSFSDWNCVQRWTDDITECWTFLKCHFFQWFQIGVKVNALNQRSDFNDSLPSSYPPLTGMSDCRKVNKLH